MKRRDVLSLLGGVAVSWPEGARGQQQRMPVIGVLSARTPETDASLFEFFRDGLKQSGYVEGKNVVIDYRWASGEYDRLPTLTTELTEDHVNVIVAFGGAISAIAAKSRAATIPIVFIGGEATRSGSPLLWFCGQIFPFFGSLRKEFIVLRDPKASVLVQRVFAN